VLAVAGAGVALWTPGLQSGRLSVPARTLFAAVARAVLDGSLPQDPDQAQTAIAAHLDRLDATIQGLAPASRQELSELLAVLCTAPGRLALTGLGSDWHLAGTEQLQKTLQAMRLSSSLTRQQVYHALRDLTNAAYFSDPSAWMALGYPGPRF
jgi:hypothetical protein